MDLKATLALLVLFACFFGRSPAAPVLSNAQYANSFLGYIRQHGKSYSSSEYLQKYDVYKKNLDFVRNFNGSFEVALNKFADLTADEFFDTYLGIKNLPALPEKPHNGLLWRTAPVTGLPTELDWRANGSVAEVKDQGQCGSCWSFSTTGALEGCHFLRTGELVSLSEQHLVDCSSSFGNNGCNGGLMTQAFDFIIKNKGVDTEESYPYTSGTRGAAGKCQANDNNKVIGATMTGYTNVKQGDENDLQAKLSRGPVSVAIDASHQSFQFYKSGIYNEPACTPDGLDHGVLAVGWGASSDGDYWIVKNSWGPNWGESGYIRMTRNKNNQCGIATMATLPEC